MEDTNSIFLPYRIYNTPILHKQNGHGDWMSLSIVF
jgi:hypothetical protein